MTESLWMNFSFEWDFKYRTFNGNDESLYCRVGKRIQVVCVSVVFEGIIT